MDPSLSTGGFDSVWVTTLNFKMEGWNESPGMLDFIEINQYLKYLTKQISSY